jgi:two-component system, OmpR family, alkaline phosphatase synthesis response regulator PhoP
LTDPRILIADDEPYLVRSLSFVLRKEGYQVDTAMDGLEALEMVRRLKPRLLFLDLQLPKMDGFEVCRQIKNDPELRDTYIILLTAKGQDEDRQKGLAAGADEYLTKPYSPKEMLTHLRNLFQS